MYGYNTAPMPGAQMMAPPPRYIVQQAAPAVIMQQPRVVVQQQPMGMVAAPMAMQAAPMGAMRQTTTVVTRTPAYGMARGQLRTDPVPVARADPRAPIMQGFLTKEGGIWKTWRKRWFVLTGDSLSYYKYPPPRCGMPRGVIRLDSIVAVSDVSGYAMQKLGPVKGSQVFEFSVNKHAAKPGRVYYVNAFNAEDKARWLTGLKVAIQQAHNRAQAANQQATATRTARIDGARGVVAAPAPAQAVAVAATAVAAPVAAAPVRPPEPPGPPPAVAVATATATAVAAPAPGRPRGISGTAL